MTPIKVLIVEDEILIAETIKMYLNERGHTVSDIAISYDEAIIAYEKEKPDVVLLDVRLYGEKSEIDFADYLISHLSGTPYIFLTSQFDKRIVQTAMTTKPLGYLTKPIQKETLWTTIELAQYISENEDDEKPILHINDGAQSHIINTDEVLYISSNHVYINFHMVDQSSYMIRNSINQIIEELDQTLFVQCHRSYIINVNHVDSYNSNHAIIRKTEIPLSRSRRSDVILKIKQNNSK